ncbi:MAG: fatty acid desaturase [Rickettsiales bacterium]|nr:fatty acid desaturase [Rickettsiales bacterium]
MSTPVLKRFYQDPYMQLRSFSLHAVCTAIAVYALIQLRSADFYNLSFSPWHLLLVPFAIYIGGLSAVFMHNATHGSFKPHWMNVVAGEIAGIHQLWGFLGWKLIHLVHHHYSDIVEHDTHPPKNYTFWQFTKIMFAYSSIKISQRYREHFGTTPRIKAIQLAGFVAFAVSILLNLALLFLLLGPVGFLWFYIPSLIANHLLYAHINHRAHPKNEEGETAPANLNHNLYFKVANLMWFGIYFHGNHHRWPRLFNPRYVPARIPRQRAVLTQQVDAA